MQNEALVTQEICSADDTRYRGESARIAAPQRGVKPSAITEGAKPSRLRRCSPDRGAPAQRHAWARAARPYAAFYLTRSLPPSASSFERAPSATARTRQIRLIQAKKRPRRPWPPQERAGARAVRQVSPAPVSYTHLTLPTILLV